MPPDRRPYKRESEDNRRDALILATLDLVGLGGPQAATVRAIAEKAGVTAGLIRHYFGSKEELVRESYRQMMGRMVSDSAKAMDEANNDPLLRLATFVAATLVPPVADPVQIGLWAGFIHSVRHDPKVREVHIQSYLEYRDMLEALIEALPASLGSKKGQAAAIACNGVIDGLWMEASVVPEMFGEKEILTIGLTSVGAILGIELLAAFNRPRDSLT